MSTLNEKIEVYIYYWGPDKLCTNIQFGQSVT